MRVLRTSCSKTPVLIVDRSRHWREKLVYILVANKDRKYPSGRRSRIIYIGTTGKGARRPAVSAVNKASEAFALRGFKRIEVHIVTCKARQAVQTWKQLESSLLAAFFSRYFRLPHFNKKKGSITHLDDVSLFRAKALEKIIRQFGE